MAESLEELYGSLTEDQKKRASTLATPEELAEFARTEGIELTDVQLEAVAGGIESWVGECWEKTAATES